jgi:xanthine dehydrogenase accessory factor
LFVDASGDVFGSVTIGGCVDGRVIEESGDVLSSATPRLVRFDLGDAEAWEIGLTCGGTVDVLLEPLSEEIAELYQIARAELEAGRAVALVTPLGTPAVRSFVLSDGSGPIADLLRSSATSRTITTDSGDVYVEILRPPTTLLIFGAGVVAIPLVSLAKVLGFRTVIVDGRPRFATRERFPDAGELRIGIVSEIAEETRLGPTTPVVLVAHDYKIDVPVLLRALRSDAPYIGLLGSRRRGAAILQMLRDEGIAEEQLKRIRVPIGLDLGADTAEEIALAVMAEIVAVRHGKSGGPLSS